MPLPFLMSSSDNFVAGGQYTRFKGAVLSGNYTATTSAGTIAEGTGGLALVQPGTITSTAGVRAQVLSTLGTAIAAANYVYISQSSAGIATSSFAAGEAAPPLTGSGAALHWTGAKLSIYSTINGGWVMLATAWTSSA